jgi:hypothetical protein
VTNALDKNPKHREDGSNQEAACAVVWKSNDESQHLCSLVVKKRKVVRNHSLCKLMSPLGGLPKRRVTVIENVR